MKPRVVILSAFFRPFRSGAEACVEEVPPLLAQRYSFVIVTAKLRRDLPRRTQFSADVSLLRIGFGLPIDKWLFPFLAPLAARRERPDIIHAVLESFAGMAMVLCRVTAPRAKRILTCQSTNTSALLAPMHHSADRVTVISSVLLERAKAFGCFATLIPNGIAASQIAQAVAGTRRVSGRVLFVGRLEPMKGVDVLLRAFAQAGLPENAALRVVGDGSQRGALEALAQSLGIAHRVTFVGYVPTPEVFTEFAQAEIFAGLSRSEALGNVFLEAQAAGCAVVATKVGGIPDVVRDGETGILVPPDDVDAAHAALCRLLADADERTRSATLAKHAMQSFDWRAIADRYAGVYADLLRSRTSVDAA